MVGHQYADSEQAKKAKLLKARMESGIRIGAANKAERQAELAAAQARAAKEACVMAVSAPRVVDCADEQKSGG